MFYVKSRFFTAAFLTALAMSLTLLLGACDLRRLRPAGQ
ncbi:hypothetical protein GGP94_002709 [Salinibacter ruber]|jgi:hypothetical protein|nr:hypothetical protein [Salinibacter ruber]MCS3612485.1 hypothetical protein [Salinibacter ruber]MCS3648323.1 hypothetical protein [Salinibacter ruber]MCS3784728.1 hypothetical protein [Salinibacter ruber]MCS4162266.1 hypothetical protein [Salinibacter ruber]